MLEMSMIIRMAEPILLLKFQKSLQSTGKRLSLLKCLLRETRANLEGHMVLLCNGLAFKNHFKMFLLNFKKCNVGDVTSRIMFCCHYFENVVVYQRFLFTKNVFIGYLAV